MYELLAHTYGKHQPCDVRLFDAYKNRLNELIRDATEPYSIYKLDGFDFCKFVTKAYQDAYTRAGITATFRKSGPCQIDSSKYLSVPHPKSETSKRTLLSVSEIEQILATKRQFARERILGHINS